MVRKCSGKTKQKPIFTGKLGFKSLPPALFYPAQELLLNKKDI